MSDKSREELEERVDELEATVKKMLPSRRQVLKGSATAAGAGMLGFSAGNASAQASTEDGDGNVGDPDDRVDVFADGVDSNIVNTDYLNDAVQVADEGDLDDAIANNERNIHLTQPVEVASTKTITERGTVIWGFGGADITVPESTGGGVYGSINGPLIESEAAAVKIRNISLLNTATGGVCYERSDGHTNVIEECQIFMDGGVGVETTGGTYEMVVRNSRIQSLTAGSGTGVDLSSSQDDEVHLNFIIGTDVGIQGGGSPVWALGNHVYGTQSGSVGADLPPSSVALFNRLDVKNGAGNDGDFAVSVGNRGMVAWNQLVVTGDADGAVYAPGFDGGAPHIVHNYIENTSSGSSDEAVALGPSVSAASLTSWADIHSNITQGFTSDGESGAHIQHTH